MEPTARLARRVQEDLGADAELVLAALAELSAILGPNERVQAAVVKLANGDLGRLDRQLREARIDWRDVLVAAEFAHEDWLERRPVGMSALHAASRASSLHEVGNGSAEPVSPWATAAPSMDGRLDTHRCHSYDGGSSGDVGSARWDRRLRT